MQVMRRSLDHSSRLGKAKPPSWTAAARRRFGCTVVRSGAHDEFGIVEGAMVKGVRRSSYALHAFQSQRDCVLKPRVARNELPWVDRVGDSQPQGGCGPPRYAAPGPQPFHGWYLLNSCSQGSSWLATLCFAARIPLGFGLAAELCASGAHNALGVVEGAMVKRKRRPVPALQGSIQRSVGIHFVPGAHG